MTDRMALMSHLEDLAKAVRQYANNGLLESAAAVANFVEGYVSATRKRFDEDSKGGLYGA